MIKDEALRLALEALTNAYWPTDSDLLPAHNIKECGEAITAIKAALEAKDEPVAWVNQERNTITWDKLYPDMDALYTTPPQRTWVGLTDEEIAIVEDEYIVDYRIPAGSAWNFAKAIEAKLKEKNA
jgi:hypothetical protein